jgi:uncharacterized membrane protein YuzA (DUF378 family)
MAKNEMEWYHYLLVILMMIGAIAWLPIGLLPLLGIAKWNLVEAVFGVGTILTNIVYTLAGAAGLISVFIFPWSK